MVPEGSSPCSQDPVTCSYPKPDQSISRPSPLVSLRCTLNIILLSTPASCKWYFSFRVSHQNHVGPSVLPCPAYPCRSGESPSGGRVWQKGTMPYFCTRPPDSSCRIRFVTALLDLITRITTKLP